MCLCVCVRGLTVGREKGRGEEGSEGEGERSQCLASSFYTLELAALIKRQRVRQPKVAFRDFYGRPVLANTESLAR